MIDGIIAGAPNVRAGPIGPRLWRTRSSIAEVDLGAAAFSVRREELLLRLSQPGIRI